MKLAILTVIFAMLVPIGGTYPWLEWLRETPNPYGPPGPTSLLIGFAIMALLISTFVVFIEATNVARWALILPLLLAILVAVQVVGFELGSLITNPARGQNFAPTWALWMSSTASLLTVAGIALMLMRGSPDEQDEPTYPYPTNVTSHR